MAFNYQPVINGIPVCFACKQYIQEPHLVAFQMNWHSYHLICNYCKRDFTSGQPLVEGQDGFAYCKECFNEAFAPKCGKCDLVIEGQMIKAGIKTFHPACFTCTTCEKEFGGVFFTADDGFPYCEKHYYQAQGLWCADCQSAIIAGKMLTMGDKSYHPACFKCNLCKEKLAGREYYEYSDKPYCKMCYLKYYG
eukprot:TRINITY_DN110_c2_g1_i1.p1 TRINITY_DN110_c2_g1~~TRINITY_DN110_c2_g1_i1.p1  ORF type:complete len:193 (-),score=55.98 TRINITY_DN110_c2_g1_i1:31-609(-)